MNQLKGEPFPVDQELVRIGSWKACAVAAALVLTVAAPASAMPSASPELEGVPAVLEAELSDAEKQSLGTLTDGTGVQLEAFVVTPAGAEIITLDADSRADAEAATDVLEAQPSVESAALTVPVRATAGALPQYGNTMLRTAEAIAEVDNPLSDVVVAVLDTGVAPHPELAAALLPGHNFTSSPGGETDTGDVHGHGTHVAGTVGADAGSQVEGVAPGVRIVPVKVIADGGLGFSNWVNSGIIWAADNGAHVINMSLGSGDEPGVFTSAVAYARARGVTVVASAGNDNSSAPHYPSDEAGVISVAAVDAASQRASFSNYGPNVDVAAPGVDIMSTSRSGGFTELSGTSMASPHVAGIAALVKAAAPNLTPDQVEQAIVTGVTDLGAAGRDDLYGHGLVNALQSVRAANAVEATLPPSTNRAPVADDEAVTVPYDSGSHRIDVLAGDTDPDGDLLGITSFTQGSHGVVTRDNGQLRYTPSGFGPFTDTFTYVLTDHHGGTATGTVRITALAPDPSNRAPVAGDDQITTVMGDPRRYVTTWANDTDPDGDRLQVVWVGQPALGRTEIIAGVAYYTPPNVASGTTSFEYRVSDLRGGSDTAVISVTIRPANAAPVAAPDRLVVPHDAPYADLDVKANDSDPDGDRIYVTAVGTAGAGVTTRPQGNHIVRYTPSGDFPAGRTDTFTYTLQDEFSAMVTGSVEVVVDPTPAAGAPGAPGLPIATSGDGSVLLRWTAPAAGGNSAISGYRVRAFENGSLISTTTTTAVTSTTLTGLRNGKVHSFAVAAVNAAGPGPDSARVTVVPGATLPGPPVITATSAGNRAVQVSWTAPASDGGNAITGYAVRAFQNGALIRTDKTGPTFRTIQVPGLTNAVPYTFAVAAINDVGTGAESVRSVPVTPRTVPGAPELHGASPRDGEVTVRWFAPINDGGSPVTGYTVHAYRGTTAAGATPAPAGATSVVVPGLTNGTAYTFIVTATNAAGPGTESQRSAPVTPRPVPVEAATDLAIAHRLGDGGMNLWRLPVSQLDRGYGLPALVKSLNFGGFSYDRSRTLSGHVGNVTGSDDGTPDHVIWHAQPNGGVLLWAVGGGPDTTPRLWQDLRTGGWSWADSVPMLGDVNGDGFDDLVVRHALGATVSNVWVFLSDGQRLGGPQLWGRTEGLAHRALLVDADVDGREDLLVASTFSSGNFYYEVLGANTTGTAFDGFSRTAFLGSAAAGWSESASRTLAADVTGDGKPDLVTIHAQSGNSGLLVWVHRNCGYVSKSTCFHAPVIWQDLRTGGWSYTGSRQYLADTDSDGTEDLISAHSQAGNPGILVWRHRSTWTALTTPEIVADLRAGGWSYAASRATVG